MKKSSHLIKSMLNKIREKVREIRGKVYRRRILREKLFDIDYYNQEYQLEYSETDGLEHFLSLGWEERKNPSAAFHTQSYIERYPDVLAAGICPLLHYVMCGKKEGRKICGDEVGSYFIEGVYWKKQYVFPVYCIDSFAGLASFEEEDGLFCLGPPDLAAIEFLRTQRDRFYDESVMALVCLEDEKMSDGLYSANVFVSGLHNPDTFVVRRKNCLFRGCTNVLKKHPEIWDNDYSFTNFFLENVAAGKIYVYGWRRAEQAGNVPIERTERIRRFHCITQNYRMEPNAIVAYFRTICMHVDSKEKQTLQCQLLREMNTTNTRVMISLYSFSNGGGEMQPIRLANELKNEGMPVVVHVLSLEDSVSAIRRCLRFDIPVIYAQNKESLSREVNFLAIDCVNTHHCNCQVLVSSIYSPRINHVATSHGMFDSMDMKDVEYLCANVFKDKVDYWTYVADKNTEPFRAVGAYQKAQFSKIPNGIEIQDSMIPVDLEKIGVPKKSFVICLASRAIAQKGWLEAIEAVKRARRITGSDIRLILLGDGPIYDKIKEKHAEYVYPMGLQNNVLSWFAASDVCILPTYYACESFPLTIVEALLCGKPILATDIGEIRKMLSDGTHSAGELLTLKNDLISVDELANKIIFLMNNDDAREFRASTAKKIRFNFDIKKVAVQYLDVYKAKETALYQHYHAAMARLKMVYMSEYCPELCPKVSVIVPNYNYAQFLSRRLESIYGQTYKNFEVILLDDCSTDSSREILEYYYQQHPDNTTTAFNENNQGVFAQWRKGMSLARGELCWIAEVDDWCDDTFLECLVPMMVEPDVRIAYGKYVFAQDEFHKSCEAYKNYIAPFGRQKWNHSYIENADLEVHQALGKRNTLVNVSGLIFVRPRDIDTVCTPEWMEMKICGDWQFYLKLLKGGRIAYCGDVQSYFRICDDQSSVGSSTYVKDVYYEEHAQIMVFLKNNYQFTDEELDEFRGFVQNHCNALEIPKRKKLELMQHLDISKMFEKSVQVIPNISFVELPYFIVLSAMESDDGDNMAFLRSGSNTGNLVFVDAAKKQFKYTQAISIAETQNTEFYGRSIICLSNLISYTRGNDRRFLETLENYANSLGGQIVIFGLGSQTSFQEQTQQELVETLSFKKIAVLRKLARKSHTIGIRGQFTADCLEVMGINNYQIIGCPSIYIQENYEHMRGKIPTLEKLLVTFTRNVPNSPYKSWEHTLMQIGAKHHAAWCQQTLPEYPEDLILSGELEPQIAEWVNSSCSIFYNCERWSQWLQDNNYTFCLGSRFHGNMMAFQNGIPTLWVDHDSRTAELLDFLHLPHVDKCKIKDVDSVNGLLDVCNYDDFLQHYPQLRKQYIHFLRENGIMLKNW